MDTIARLRIKRTNGIPTIPDSADHRNGDWIDTDIYPLEFAMDVNTGRVYTRNFNDEIINPDGSPASKIYKALVSQTGTGAPTDVIHSDMLSGAWSYISTGHFRYTATGVFPVANKIWYQITSNITQPYSTELVRNNDNSVDLYTYNSSGTLSNDILINASLLMEVLN